ncbi:TIGR02281 family clan AA aspartic protease [Neptuniibacter sp. QD29_5]|uniref:retropepsin-like aspartic protease family protein n=1 Tax=Neptuniibacter sp. QD29_5 TaxID=3398207 RepID=UPI0039F55521
MESQHTPKRIGQGMWAVAWVLFLGMLWLFFEEQVNDKYNPNRNLVTSSSNEVVLQQNRAGHYVAPGEINGQPVIFLLDTGATNISVPQEVADRIGLRPGLKRQVDTANGVIDVYNTELNTVTLGGISMQNVRGHINPHMDGETVLLGMSFMKYLEIIQKGNTLTLRR